MTFWKLFTHLTSPTTFIPANTPGGTPGGGMPGGIGIGGLPGGARRGGGAPGGGPPGGGTGIPGRATAQEK